MDATSCLRVSLQPPRAEAVSILGTLLSFPNHFLEVPVFQSNLLTTALIEADDLKDRIIDLLLKAGKREPAGLARCVNMGFYLVNLVRGIRQTLRKVSECDWFLIGQTFAT